MKLVKTDKLPSSILKVECKEDLRIVWNDIYRDEGKRYGELPSVAAQLALPELTKLSLSPQDSSLLLGSDNYQARNISLLELGCGYGRDILFYKKFIPSLHVKAMDWSVIAIELLQEEIQESRISGVKPIVADVLEGPIDDELYDVVYANYLFHYLTKAERGHLLDRCTSCLNAKGVFISTFVSTNDTRLLRKSKPKSKNMEIYPNLTWHFFDEQEICEALKSHGLQLLYPLKEVAEWEKIGLDRELTVFWFMIAKKI